MAYLGMMDGWHGDEMYCDCRDGCASCTDYSDQLGDEAYDAERYREED